MKTIFKISFFLMLGALFLCAAPLPNSQHEALKFTVSGTHFVAPVRDSGWANSTNDEATFARYTDYTGETYVTLSVSKNASVEIETSVKVKYGKLTVIVEDSKGHTLLERTFDKSSGLTGTFDFKAKETYKLRYIGAQTRGSYQTEWTTQS